MILKFRSNQFKSEDDQIIFHGENWSWIDDIAKIQNVESVELPLSVEDDSEDIHIASCYMNPNDHFSDSHWVGVNPRLYNLHSPEACARDNKYSMYYIWKRNGKIELLAVGFLTEIYLLNDEGKTIDQIVNSNW